MQTGQISFVKIVSHKKTTLFLVLMYLYLSVCSVFGVAYNHHNPMSDCPYMTGQHSLCTMDAFEHIATWKSLILTVPSGIYVLALFTLVLVFQIFLSASPPLLRQFLYYRKVKSQPIIFRLTLAFSDGILNPKLY